jgi:hypothetical protein
MTEPRGDGGSGAEEATAHLSRTLMPLATLRMVFFAGLPATGKSLLVHELAGLAHAVGREVNLLQWDVARPAFEASAAGRRYPIVDGVTDPLIRRAVGLWARAKIGEWDRQASASAILIGETPFVGGRLVDLARRADDAAEAVLTSPGCRFVIVVPTNAVRRHVESERMRRSQSPVNAGEREEAPPHLLRQMWLDLLEAGTALGIAAGEGTTGTDPSTELGTGSYESGTYERIYGRLLRHRRFEFLSIDAVFDTRGTSAYEFAFPVTPVLPSAHEMVRFIGEVEKQPSVAPWWEV